MDTASTAHLRIVGVSHVNAGDSRIDEVETSVNKSLKGKWAALACHETGSLVVQVSRRSRHMYV